MFSQVILHPKIFFVRTDILNIKTTVTVKKVSKMVFLLHSNEYNSGSVQSNLKILSNSNFPESITYKSVLKSKLKNFFEKNSKGVPLRF